MTVQNGTQGTSDGAEQREQPLPHLALDTHEEVREWVCDGREARFRLILSGCVLVGVPHEDVPKTLPTSGHQPISRTRSIVVTSDGCMCDRTCAEMPIEPFMQRSVGTYPVAYKQMHKGPANLVKDFIRN